MMKKNYQAGYNDGHEEGKNKFIVTLGLLLIILWIAFTGDTADVVNVRDFGTRMCAHGGLAYAGVSYDIPDHQNTPVIHCVKKEELKPAHESLIGDVVVSDLS